MVKYNEMDIEALRAAVVYNAETGKIQHAINGSPCLARPDNKGHLSGKVAGFHFKAHRVAWALHYGQWPSGDIDHINGNPADNRACNLRLATNQQNQFNTKGRAGSSQFKGVSWKAADRKWQVRIAIDGKMKHVGYFREEEEAARAYDKHASLHHGQFARLNFVCSEYGNAA